MSETDSFIREVTEEVQKDRMFRLWKKYGALIIGGIVVIVGATAVWNWMQHQEAAARVERGEAFLAAAVDDAAAQQALFEANEGVAAAIAGLRLAQARAADGDVEGAAAAYDAVAGIPGVGAQYADLARLEALRLRAPVAGPQDTIASLAPLTAEDAPYRVLALELRAALLMNTGEVEAARADLDAILADPAATGESRARADALLATIGGDGSGS